jgi:hypothetical protein
LRPITRLHRTRVLPLTSRTGLLAAALLLAGCASTADLGNSASAEADEEVPVALIEAAETHEAQQPPDAAEPASAAQDGADDDATAASEADTAESADAGPAETLEEVIVASLRPRHDRIRDLVVEARALLRDVELKYVFVGKGRRETLRGRPIAFALWSESKLEWSIAHVEIPRPPVRWRPGGRPLPVRVLTPGIQARHIKGTGAERLMFAFLRNGEPLRVYGRKFPVFDRALLAKRRWRAVAQTAQPIVYLPFTTDTLDPGFISNGREYLLSTAARALVELRAAQVPSLAYPGVLLADVVPAEVVTTLAVIEQTDDTEFIRDGLGAFEAVLSHYGLKREEAFNFSISRAGAVGPMQFTNFRGNGTYSLVVRRCRGANLDPDFVRGATDLLNAMKAAICLLDLELSQMRADLRDAYRNDPAVLGIFPVAAYNGGPRNVTRLLRALTRMRVPPETLTRAGELPAGSRVACPCVWKRDGDDVLPVPIPRYNNENRWYIEKYQNLLSVFE